MAVPTTEAGVAILITSDSDQGQLPERRAGRRQRKSRLEPTLGGANRRHTLLRYTSLFGLLALVLNPATRNGGSKQAGEQAGSDESQGRLLLFIIGRLERCSWPTLSSGRTKRQGWIWFFRAPTQPPG
jgi:hypothetical protein